MVAEKFSRRVDRLRVVNGFVEGSELGALVDANAVKKVNAHLENALSLGGRATHREVIERHQPPPVSLDRSIIHSVIRMTSGSAARPSVQIQ